MKHLQEVSGGSKFRDAFLAKVLQADASQLQEESALMVEENARLVELLELERGAHKKEREARLKIEEEVRDLSITSLSLSPCMHANCQHAGAVGRQSRLGVPLNGCKAFSARNFPG